MDILLGKVTQQAMNYAIRSGITITAGYAFRQSARLLNAVEGNEKDELQALQERLKSKIMIISPAIDMIELISARGNTTLESAVSLTKSLRWDIQALGQRLARAANEETLWRTGSSKAKSKAHNELMLSKVVTEIKKLLTRIEDAVPLINLAITTSGANLSSSVPSTVSPSRLLQASTFLTAGDTQYSTLGSKYVQIGPTFVLSLYMLFASNVRPQDEEEIRSSTWKEVIHKTRVKLVRIPIDALHDLPDPTSNADLSSASESPETNRVDWGRSNMSAEVRSDEFAYQIIVIEDLDDERVHTCEDEKMRPGPYDDVELAGIREAIPIHEISKIFYADTGKILNIGNDGETNSPVLLLKRDLNAIPPRRMVEKHASVSSTNGIQDFYQSEIDAQILRESRASSPIPESLPKPKSAGDNWRFPANLDPEWLAFEVFTNDPGSDSESESSASTSTPAKSRKPTPSRSPSLDPKLTAALSDLDIDPQTPQRNSSRASSAQAVSEKPTSRFHAPAIPTIRTSLSLLETLLRLLSLQQFQQTSHLAIPDELLNFFLSEAATTGAATGDEGARRRLRNEARRRVGFDPYDESPIKRRGEAYQSRGSASQAGDHYEQNKDGWDEAQGWDEDLAITVGSRADGEWDQTNYDEGYYTNRYSSQRRDYSSRIDSSPRPQMMLRSRENTPQSPASASSRPKAPRYGSGGRASPQTPSGPVGRVKGQAGEIGRKGSPLARPGTAVTDEGVVVTPVSEERKAEKANKLNT